MSEESRSLRFLALSCSDYSVQMLLNLTLLDIHSTVVLLNNMVKRVTQVRMLLFD